MIGPSNSVALQTRQPRKFDFQKLRHVTPAQKRTRTRRSPCEKTAQIGHSRSTELGNLSLQKTDPRSRRVNLLPIQHQQMAPMTAGRGKQIPKGKLKLPRSPHRVP